MNLDRYTFEVSADNFEYEFISNGPKGAIKKRVRFDELRAQGGTRLFNLAFGDWEAVTQTIDDEVVSNNGDMEKATSTLQEAVWQMKPAKVNKNIVSHKDDPFIVKKREAAERLLKNVTLPEVPTVKK
ncbi:MAG TPA: hypothetical protein VNS58_16570 [Puia sp.]|nr:hypothetical protein [Puia sp.]